MITVNRLASEQRVRESIAQIESGLKQVLKMMEAEPLLDRLDQDSSDLCKLALQKCEELRGLVDQQIRDRDEMVQERAKLQSRIGDLEKEFYFIVRSRV
jgi:hypothetical protein